MTETTIFHKPITTDKTACLKQSSSHMLIADIILILVSVSQLEGSTCEEMVYKIPPNLYGKIQEFTES